MRRSRRRARSPRSGLPRSPMSKRCDGGVTDECRRRPRCAHATRKSERRRSRSHPAREIAMPITLRARARTCACAPACASEDGRSTTFHNGPGFAAADVEDQSVPRVRSPATLLSKSTPRSKRCDASLREVVAARLAGDRIGKEERGLEERCSWSSLPPLVLAAHDAGEAERTAVVRDRTNRRRSSASGLPVEQFERFIPRARSARASAPRSLPASYTCSG
jgi:hypothetical protein